MNRLEKLYQDALFVRLFEDEIACLSDAGLVPGLVHLCSGAELVEGSLCGLLKGPVDQVTGSHRSHGLALMMGADPRAVAAEILGLRSGLSKGQAGTQHLIAPENGFLASNGIVGAQVPLAAGAAFSAKLKGTSGVGVCFYGDGAANQGAVFETLNMAAALELPLLFVMQNNGVAQTTKAGEATGGADLLARAASFGVQPYRMDGYDAESCCATADEALQYVRETSKPAIIEATVPRLSGHYHGAGGDDEGGSDPLLHLEKQLGSLDLDSILHESKQKINHIFDSIRAELHDQEVSA